jgi:hypothetical protein
LLALGVFFISLSISLTAVAQPARAPLAPEQLDTLVAPIALYPDPLLSQVLAASTYPLELVEAQQWLDQHRDLQGQQLIEAARQMNWDASVQAMVVFPDVLRTLTQNVSWTTDLGNAFLSQQAEVMNAIQRLRARARDNGRLTSTPEQEVTNELGPDRNVVAIQPADPQVLYVPTYNPNYVWGPPPAGAYPALGYPSEDAGYVFAAATAIASLFTGLLSWSGWGWGMSWLTHGLFLNGLFFNHFGLGGGGGGYGGYGYGAGFAGQYAGRTAWVHNPVHRLGVPYSTGAVASRFGSASRAGWQTFGGNRPVSGPAPGRAGTRGGPPVASGGWRNFGSHAGGESYRPQAAPGYRAEGRAQYQAAPNYRGYSGPANHSNRMPQSYAPSSQPQHYARSYSEPKYSGGGGSGHYSAPKSHSFKAPKMPKMKAPKISSHSSKGHSGGHSKGHKH